MSNINYNDIDEITVHNQEELDDIPLDFKGKIYIECTATVRVSNRYYWSVVVWENSSVVAWGNSSVEANSNVQVVNHLINGKIKLSGNAREVFMPKNIFEFMDFYGIKHTKTKAVFYKAVRKTDNGTLYANYSGDFEYVVGEMKSEPNINTDPSEDCGSGIHISNLSWALNFGNSWSNLAIIEVETKIEDIVLPKNTDGEVRTSKVKVLREVPLEECGVYGNILAKRLAK